jgi:predicted DNA-binding transcriptional regulator AlpA
VTSPSSLDLMGAAEIGRLLGVSRQRVQQLVKTPGFPPPVAHLDMGKVWLSQDIAEWARRTRGPQPGNAPQRHPAADPR